MENEHDARFISVLVVRRYKGHIEVNHGIDGCHSLVQHASRFVLIQLALRRNIRFAIHTCLDFLLPIAFHSAGAMSCVCFLDRLSFWQCNEDLCGFERGIA